jgi:hypothetical protein
VTGLGSLLGSLNAQLELVYLYLLAVNQSQEILYGRLLGHLGSPHGCLLLEDGT